MSKSFLDLPLTEIVPSSLLTDQNIVSMCEALQGELDLLKEASIEIELLSRIDELPEPVLRMLAWENRISSIEWALALTIEEKRALVKDSFEINRRRGTRGSIERVFSLLGMKAEIEEWFEYGGDPGTFRISVLDIGDRGILPEEHGMIDMLILRYKALTRWIESIVFQSNIRVNMFVGAATLTEIASTIYIAE